jgi:hypothetical protein
MLLTCCSPACVWFMVLLVSWFPLVQWVALLEVFVVVWATAQWPKARHGAVTRTSNTPKTATHWTKGKSTNKQNHKPNTCMPIARYEHKNEPVEITTEKQNSSSLKHDLCTWGWPTRPKHVVLVKRRKRVKRMLYQYSIFIQTWWPPVTSMENFTKLDEMYAYLRLTCVLNIRPSLRQWRDHGIFKWLLKLIKCY